MIATNWSRPLVRLFSFKASGLWLLAWVLGAASALAQPGTLDPAYGATAVLDNAVYAQALQADGNLLAGGAFTKLNALIQNRLIRLGADGTPAASLNLGAGFNDAVYSLALQADGKILLGGRFTAISGTNWNRIARLNGDGGVDTTFTPAQGVNSDVDVITVAPGNQILIGGRFTQVTGTNRSYLARLQANGVLDPAFAPVLNGAVLAIKAQTDGKWLIGGEFTLVNGQLRNRIARLNSDGTLDSSFDPASGPNSSVRSIALQADGKILIGGDFSSVNGGTPRYIVRLDSQGLPDPSFAATANNAVYAVFVQPDNRVVIGGIFTSVNGVTKNRLARLRSDGSIDPSFGIGTGPNDAVYALTLQADGDIVVGGDFTQVSGLPRSRMARVQGLPKNVGGELEFAAATYQVVETQPSVTITVKRNGDSSTAVAVNYATSNGTANAGNYTPQSGTLNFGIGEKLKTFTVPILHSASVQDDRTVNLTLTAPSGGAVLGGQPTALLSIQNVDPFVGVGSLDVNFGPAVAGGGVNAMAMMPNGKIIVVGPFDQAGGLSGGLLSRLGIARFNADGTLDGTFYPPTWLNNVGLAMVAQGADQLVVGGRFTTVNGATQNRLVRFNENGTVDSSFDPGSGANSEINALLKLSGGRLLVGGRFTTFSGVTQRYLARTFSDGSPDPEFVPAVNGAVLALAAQADGKLLIGGEFTTVNGELRNRIARLNDDGSLDLTFDAASGPNSTVRSIALQADGKLIIGGDFSSVNGGTPRYIARLETNGLPDPSFSATANNAVYAVLVQPDSRVVMGGIFTTVNGIALNRLARLRTDGSVDPSFKFGTGANAEVYALAAQADGAILIGGNFTQFNGLTRAGLARVQAFASNGGGELQFSAANYPVAETLPSVTVTVDRQGDTNTAVTVKYATSSGTATVANYTPQSGTLSFALGEKTKTFAVPILHNLAVQDDLTVNLTLTTPTGGAVLGGQPAAIITIQNTDLPTGVGSLDIAFGAGVGGGGINALALGSDGKIAVVGAFDSALDSLSGFRSRLGIARFNSDGTLDAGFAPATWLNNVGLAITFLADSKLVVAGRFTTVNGATYNRLARFETDGTLDPTFNPGAGANSEIDAVLPSSSGKLLIGGRFTTYAGAARPYLARVLVDGSLDAAYQPNVNGAVLALAVQSDGKLLIGGEFTVVNGQLRNRIARLNADGTLDNGFDPALGPNSTVRSIALQTNGRIILGGHFSSVNGGTSGYIVRLDSQGLPDPSFAATANNAVYSILVQPDNRIVIGGEFTTVNLKPFNRLARLRSDGTVDPSFNIGIGANAAVNTLALQTDGSVVLGGEFTAFNSLSRSYLARVQGLPKSLGGELEFAAAAYQIAEDQGSVTITVKRNGNASTTATINYATSNLTANVSNYTPKSGTLNFAIGDTQKSFTIPILHNPAVQDDRTVNLALSSPTGAVLGGQPMAVLTILNLDLFDGVSTLDLNFGATVLGGGINAVTVGPDGKFVVAGSFDSAGSFGGMLFGRNGIARFNADGTLDTGFNPSAWLNNAGLALAIQGDNKLLVGGRFTAINGATYNRLARLNANGTLDSSFNPGAGANSEVNSIVVLSDGSLLVAGRFTQYAGVNRSYLAHVFTDGTIDPTFVPAINGAVLVVTQQPDGKLLIGGEFTQVNAQTRNRIARLNTDGSLDFTFDPALGPNSTVQTIVVQPGGKIILGGSFSQVAGVNRRYLARLNASGLLDTTYPSGTGPNNAVRTAVVRQDGEMIIGGDFTTVNDLSYPYLAILDATGAIDPVFTVGSGANAAVNALAVQSGGGVIIGGNFTLFNGLTRNYLARLNGIPGPTPIHFTAIARPVNGLLKLTLTGRPGQGYVLSNSEDLLTWLPFATNTVPGAGADAINVQTGGATKLYFRALNIP